MVLLMEVNQETHALFGLGTGMKPSSCKHQTLVMLLVTMFLVNGIFTGLSNLQLQIVVDGSDNVVIDNAVQNN
jgi:hypothetical protein